MSKLLRFVVASIMATTLQQTATSQSLSVNTTGAVANVSSILDVSSTAKGVLIPRMDKTAKGLIATPANGLLVYQTGPDSIGFHYYDLPNTKWVYINASGFSTDTTAWKITGNSNITSSNFLGTTNDTALRFRVRNTPSGIVDSASGNTGLGYSSLLTMASGINNTALGVSALRNDNLGTGNVAIGRNAMLTNRNGGYNTVVGHTALINNDSSYYTTAIGYNALLNHKNGYWNTAVGMQSLFTDSTGQQNTGLGVQALYLNKTGSFNTAMGTNALFYNKQSENTGLGFSAGFYVDYDPVNFPTKEVTYIGTGAGFGFYAGKKSTGIGYRALYNYESAINTIYGNSTGRNTAIGDSAMGLTYGSNNVAIGTEALSRARSSSVNVAIGDSSLGGALNTNGNVAIGYKTLSKQQGQGYNTAVGYYSQRDSSINTYYNTSIGAFSMEYNRTGIYNTGLGLSAMRNADSTSYNTAVGADAMYNHKKNGSNLAAGAFAMRGDSAGYWNTALGSEAMDRQGLDGTARGTGYSNVAVGFRALRGAREAIENTAVGVGALESDSSGNYNTAVGRYASFLNKRGDFNVSMGYRASNNADTAINTTAIGSYAIAFNKQDNNVAVGYAAGYTAGSQTGYDPKEITFVGMEAGRGSWASNKNTAVGFRALSNTDAGFGIYDYVTGRNTAIGDSAMAFSIGGSNVVAGTEALSNTGTQGTFNNVAIGDSAMGNAKSNSGALVDNVAVGFKSLTQVKNQGNVAMGAYAGQKLANTVWNTAIGYHALETDTTGSENTVIGTSAFRSNPNGIRNVSLGINTGYWSTSSQNTYLGSYAGEGISGRSTGGSNTGIGYVALRGIRSGTQNVALGEYALVSDSSGSLNVSIGAGSMESHLRGNDNIAMGFWAGRTDTAATGVIYIGRDAGYSNQRSNTVAIGYQALLNNSLGLNSATQLDSALYNTGVGYHSLVTNTKGGWNTALGFQAGNNNLTGFYNTSVGVNALLNTSISDNNTALGTNAGADFNNGARNTFIGSNSDANAAGRINATAIGANAQVAQNNSMVLGSINGINGATANTNVGIGTTTPGALLDVNGTFSLGIAGTVLNEVIKAIATVTIPALAIGTTNSFTISVPGASGGSTVSISPASALNSGTVISYAYVAGTGTVQVFVNTPFAAGVASQIRSFYVTVIR